MIISAFDIETIPNQTLPENCIPQFDPSEIKHGNSGPDKRAEKEAMLREQFESKRDKTMSVSPALAQICTFCGIQYDTEEEKIIETVSVQVTDEYNTDDLDAVTEGWEFIRQSQLARIPIVSFNGIGFDMPVMWHRAMSQDVIVDPVMYRRLTPRYGNNHHYDLLGVLAGWTIDKQRGKGLDFWLNLYRLGSKGDMDGSKVYPAWKEKRFDEIQKYCESDVINTCALFQRVEPWIKIVIE